MNESTLAAELPPAVRQLLEQFVQRLLAENERVNLTAIRDPAEAWRLHICDSLALAPLIEASAPKRMLDLGTGGGVPGLPLACIFPGVQVTLMDATRKKLEAVERIVAGLGLKNVDFQWGRAEELAHHLGLREKFDAVTARAVGGLAFLLEYTAGFVRVGGECWLYQTQTTQARDAAAVAAACGFELAKERPYRLPGDTQDRLILTYRKVAPLAAELPRHPSIAKGRPMR